MSQENVKLAQRASVALNIALKAGDLRPFLDEFCDPQIVFKPAGILPETAEMHGHDGMLQFGTAQTEAFEEFGVEPQEYIDAGDRVVVPLRFGGRARHTGLDVAFEASRKPSKPWGLRSRASAIIGTSAGRDGARP